MNNKKLGRLKYLVDIKKKYDGFKKKLAQLEFDLDCDIKSLTFKCSYAFLLLIYPGIPAMFLDLFMINSTSFVLLLLSFVIQLPIAIGATLVISPKIKEWVFANNVDIIDLKKKISIIEANRNINIKDISLEQLESDIYKIEASNQAVRKSPSNCSYKPRIPNTISPELPGYGSKKRKFNDKKK